MMGYNGGGYGTVVATHTGTVRADTAVSVLSARE
jgi:hypothetical protein